MWEYRCRSLTHLIFAVLAYLVINLAQAELAAFLRHARVQPQRLAHYPDFALAQIALDAGLILGDQHRYIVGWMNTLSYRNITSQSRNWTNGYGGACAVATGQIYAPVISAFTPSLRSNSGGGLAHPFAPSRLPPACALRDTGGGHRYGKEPVANQTRQKRPRQKPNRLLVQSQGIGQGLSRQIA